MTPAERWTDDAWQALDEARHADAAELAMRAIMADHLAFDAHVVLARCTASDTIAIAILREAALEGKRQHDNVITGTSGRYWTDLTNRPYMRAMHELAVTLWRRGLTQDRHDAIDVATRMLRLNPNDNQGIRFLLWNWLPEMGLWDEMRPILRKHRDERRCETLFTSALDAIRRHDGVAADLLAQAIRSNVHVAPLLLADRPPADPGTDSVAWMGPEEAAAYAHHAHANWRKIEGALDMLRRVHSAGIAQAASTTSDHSSEQISTAGTPKLRKTTREALRALHAGLVGLEFPTYKMIPRPAGELRVMMRGGVFRTEDGRIALVDFDDAIRDPDDATYKGTGYTDACYEDILAHDLAISVDMEDTPYSGLLLTPNGLSIANALFGSAKVALHVASDEDGGHVITLVPPASTASSS
jgi:hypothetical protein